MMKLFQIEDKQNGYHIDANGESFYFIKNPALGLWSYNPSASLRTEDRSGTNE